MKFGYAKPLIACLIFVVVPVVMAEEGQKPEAPCENAASALPTIELSDLLDSVSRKSNKEFLIDSRVRSEVVIGQLGSGDVSFPILHSILRTNGLAAVTVQGIVNIVPVAAIRQYPLPVLFENDETIADDEWVTRVMRPKRVRAVTLVPVLRPLLPQQGHLSAVPVSNTLTIVARYANARRIAELVRDMDEHTPEPAEDLASESHENGRTRFETNYAKRETIYLADVIRATPYTVNDQLRGYLLWPGSDTKKYTALGLRTGDLLRDIAGAPLSDPLRAKKVFELLCTADQVSVTIERNGQSEELVLNTSLLNLNDDR